jgi:hypothetical protein
MNAVSATCNTIALAVALCATQALAATPVTQAGGFHLDAPLARVFPLFTAAGERAWADGWEPEFLSGGEERGSVFRARTHAGMESTWIVTDYRPAQGHVSYARLAHGSNFGLVDVTCTSSSSGGTDVSVRYTLTGVSADGERLVSQFLGPDHYHRMMEEWRSAIVAVLAKG